MQTNNNEGENEITKLNLLCEELKLNVLKLHAGTWTAVRYRNTFWILGHQLFGIWRPKGVLTLMKCSDWVFLFLL